VESALDFTAGLTPRLNPRLSIGFRPEVTLRFRPRLASGKNPAVTLRPYLFVNLEVMLIVAPRFSAGINVIFASKLSQGTVRGTNPGLNPGLNLEVRFQSLS